MAAPLPPQGNQAQYTTCRSGFMASSTSTATALPIGVVIDPGGPANYSATGRRAPADRGWVVLIPTEWS